MPYGLETGMGVEVVNTMVTAIASVLGILLNQGLQKCLARRVWESTTKGRPTDILVSSGLNGLPEFYWKVRNTVYSARTRVICNLLPYILVIAVLQLVEFSTSGVLATASTTHGSSVPVIGSVSNSTNRPIETLSIEALLSLEQGEVEGGAYPFLLGSPELGNYGSNVTGLEWGLKFDIGSSSTVDNPILTIYGSDYTVEQDGEGEGTYAVTTCLVVNEEDNSYAIDTCAGVEVELESLEIVVESVQIIWWEQSGCEHSEDAIFNQGVTYYSRSLILNSSLGTFTESEMVENTAVSALCASIYESIIEACIFEVGDHIYIGDWNILAYNHPCSDTSSGFYPEVYMYAIEVEGKGGTLLMKSEFRVAAAMLAEVVAGSGTIYSRQQLALILGVFSRIAGMKNGVGTAYYPEAVVVVSISYVVLGLWGFLLVVVSVIHLFECCLGHEVFIPSSAWDWYAVGARECLRREAESYFERPEDRDYAAQYGSGKPWVNSPDIRRAA